MSKDVNTSYVLYITIYLQRRITHWRSLLWILVGLKSTWYSITNAERTSTSWILNYFSNEATNLYFLHLTLFTMKSKLGGYLMNVYNLLCSSATKQGGGEVIIIKGSCDGQYGRVKDRENNIYSIGFVWENIFETNKAMLGLDSGGHFSFVSHKKLQGLVWGHWSCSSKPSIFHYLPVISSLFDAELSNI